MRGRYAGTSEEKIDTMLFAEKMMALFEFYAPIIDPTKNQLKQLCYLTAAIHILTHLKERIREARLLRNLRYMRDFAIAYPDFSFLQRSVAKFQVNENEPFIILQRSVAKLPWGHNCTLLDKAKEPGEKLFYAQKAIQNGWTRDMLVNQMETGLYKRQGSLTNNFTLALPAYDSELANQIFKDPYQLDFIMLGERAKERDLENALMAHITNLLLELGEGFAFMGRQKKFEAGGREFFIDLLFYHTKLRRHIIIELKIGEFEPEFVSKMNFYLGVADDSLKGRFDEPSIGLILCKTNNRIVAEYALRDTSKPIGIAEYKIAEIRPENIKSELPSIEEIEQRMEELKEDLSPAQKSLDALKQKLAGLKGKEVKKIATTEILFEIFDKSLMPLYKALLTQMEPFKEWFVSTSTEWKGKETWINNVADLPTEWRDEAFLKSGVVFPFVYKFSGLKKTWPEAFNTSFLLNFIIDTYWYGFTLMNYNQQQPFLQKQYGEQLTVSEIAIITDAVVQKMVADIDWRVNDLNKEK